MVAINGWLPGLDSAALYAFLARTDPALYLEVGSGNSTKFARRAITDHGLRTRLVSIDPQPRAEIDALFAAYELVSRRRLEHCRYGVFKQPLCKTITATAWSSHSYPRRHGLVFRAAASTAKPKYCNL